MYPEAITTLRNVGKLRKDDADDFSNVENHCVAVALPVEVVRHYLDIDPEVTEMALLHDLRKRWERRPQDFTPEEAELLQAEWGKIPLEMQTATTPIWGEADCQQRTSATRLVRYADMCTLDTEFAGIRGRADGTKVRWPHLDWPLNNRYGFALQRKLWAALWEKGARIALPNDLPAWIRRRIQM